MTVSRRRVRQAAPLTLTLVFAATVVSAAVLSALAYLVHLRADADRLPALLVSLTLAVVMYGWRYGIHPSLSATDDGVVLTNPWRTVRRTLVHQRSS